MSNLSDVPIISECIYLINITKPGLRYFGNYEFQMMLCVEETCG